MFKKIDTFVTFCFAKVFAAKVLLKMDEEGAIGL